MLKFKRIESLLMGVLYMVNRETLLVKLQQIDSDMAYLENYCREWQNEYNILTDQYMNGNIHGSIGKSQRAITNKIEKAQKRYFRLQQEAFKIIQKLLV